MSAAADENEAKDGILPTWPGSPPLAFQDAGKGVEGRLLLLPPCSRKELGLSASPCPVLRLGVDEAESEFPSPTSIAGLSLAAMKSRSLLAAQKTESRHSHSGPCCLENPPRRHERPRQKRTEPYRSPWAVSYCACCSSSS